MSSDVTLPVTCVDDPVLNRTPPLNPLPRHVHVTEACAEASGVHGVHVGPYRHVDAEEPQLSQLRS